MEDNIIESSVDELLELLKERKIISISVAADILKLNRAELDNIISALEEKGFLMIRYPVIGEAQITLKSYAPEKIKLTSKDLDDSRFIEPALKTKVSVKNRVTPNVNSKELIRRIELVEDKVINIKSDLNETIYRDDLEEILLIINGLKDIDKISFYLKEFMSLIHKMKEKGVWTKEDEKFTESMLSNIVTNWEEEFEPQIAQLFKFVKEKIRLV